MKYLPKALLIYSTVVCTSLFLIGLVTSRTDTALFSSLLLVPVIIFLFLKSSRLKAYEVNSKGFVLVVPVLGLVLLSFVSFTNLSKTEAKKTVSESYKSTKNVTIVSGIEKEILPSVEYIYIKLNSPEEFVNIKSNPNSQSETIGQALSGERLDVIDKEDEWYKVGTIYGEGYVHQDFVDKM